MIGFGKDALARTYVSLASKHHVPSLDLSALSRMAVAEDRVRSLERARQRMLRAVTDRYLHDEGRPT